jgi:hypothetical protein
MNLSLYGHDDHWIDIDCGMMIRQDLPDFPLQVPNLDTATALGIIPRALFITHGHEDHIGAAAWLWPHWGCPIYATPLAAGLLRLKFSERGLATDAINVVEPGEGAYVLRTYPVVYPWGEPATQALESTFARDSEAYWSLFDHYFAEQSSFDSDNVLERTATFLTEETDIDGEAVASDARDKAHDDAVQADIQAAEDAGLGETTPIILLFEDGEFVTKVNGSVSYDIIAEALGEREE